MNASNPPVSGDGEAGPPFYTVAEAAERLGTSRSSVNRMADAGAIARWSGAEPAPKSAGRGGRPPAILLVRSDVERVRAGVLDRLHATDRDEANAQLRALSDQAQGQEAGLTALTALMTDAVARIDALTERNQALEEALRLSLVVDGARVDQLRQFLIGSPSDL